MPNEYDELGPGEIRRGFARLEQQVNDLANKMTAAIGPMSEVKFRCEEHRKDIDQLADKLRVLEKAQNLMELRAAGIGGGVAAIAFIVKFLIGK